MLQMLSFLLSTAITFSQQPHYSIIIICLFMSTCYSLYRQTFCSVGSLHVKLSAFFFCRQHSLFISSAFFFLRQPSPYIRSIYLSSVVSLYVLASAFIFCRQPSSVGCYHVMSAVFSIFFLSAALSFCWQPTSSANTLLLLLPSATTVGNFLLLLASYLFCPHPSPTVGCIIILSTSFFFCQQPLSSFISIFHLAENLLLLSAAFSVSNLQLLLSYFFFCQQLRVLLAAYYSGVILILLSLAFSLCQNTSFFGRQPSPSVGNLVFLSAFFCFCRQRFFACSFLLLLATYFFCRQYYPSFGSIFRMQT